MADFSNQMGNVTIGFIVFMNNEHNKLAYPNKIVVEALHEENIYRKIPMY